MPELPEVETVRQSLLGKLVGRRIEAVQVREPRLRYPVDRAQLERHVSGRNIVAIERRAKYLFVHLEGERRLVIHLGMSGRLLVEQSDDPVPTHVHATFRLDDGMELRYRDPRRFGMIDFLRAEDIPQDKRFSRLGPEPLGEGCSDSYFYARSRGSRKPVKNFLMDSQHVVGVGNIYASEALFLAGIHPQRAAGRISRKRWQRLTAAVKEVLEQAIRKGGTTLNDFHDASGKEGEFQPDLRVYHRADEACTRCEAPIRKKILAGRSTFYCASCQT